MGRLNPPERFLSKISETSTVGCWLWTAHRKGYGVYSIKSRPVLAHRFSYEAIVGPIEGGMQLDHLCRNRHCVNPAHLQPVTCRENLLRGDTIAARLLADPDAARKLSKGEL